MPLRLIWGRVNNTHFQRICCAYIDFNINFFGNTYSKVQVNTTGAIYLNNDLNSSAHITPLFIHADTSDAKNSTTYGKTVYDNHLAFAVNWINIAPADPSGSSTDTRRNSFQVILGDRSDVGAGDFDFIFNYDSIEWDNTSNPFSSWPDSYLGYMTTLSPATTTDGMSWG